MLNHPDYSQLKVKPSDLIRHRTRHPSEPAGEACGCCPACGEFVVLAAPVEGVKWPCPRCGAFADHLVPLGFQP